MSIDRLEKVAEKCRDKGATVITISCDIANKEDLAEALTEFDESNPIGLLIANAGETKRLLNKYSVTVNGIFILYPDKQA